jgi:hypothetical protein
VRVLIGAVETRRGLLLLALVMWNSSCYALGHPGAGALSEGHAIMLVPEQDVVLRYLGRRATALFREVLQACLPGASQDWGARILCDLEWLGYITIYPGANGEPMALQLTDKGRQQAHQLQGMHRRAGLTP